MESYIIACYRAYIIEPFKLHQKNPVSRATICGLLHYICTIGGISLKPVYLLA